MTRNVVCPLLLLFALWSSCLANPLEISADSKSADDQQAAQKPAKLAPQQADSDYVLGPSDQITLVVSGLEDDYKDKVFRIDASGGVSLPLVGRVHAAGLNTAELESELQVRLKSILKDPQVVVSISGFGSEPVSVLGAVKNPGIVQLQGRKTLFEVLSMAGGLEPEAGYLVQVTRPLANGTIPVANVRTDPSSETSVASIRLKDIINVPNAKENIEILPGDSISVPKTGVVYVVGSVAKPGGFPLDENETMSALQVVSLAEGFQNTASPSKARILRTVPGAPARMEIPVNLSQLMAGKSTDVQLHADDILFVPGSNAKKAGLRTLDAIVNAATYATVYARP